MNSDQTNRSVVRDPYERPRNPVAVLLLAALIVFCLSMISLAGATTARLAPTLEARLSGQVTIAVWGQGLESVDAAAARAAELLSAQAGVRRATVLEADEHDATVGEVIAGGSRGGDGPRLLSLSGAPDMIPSASYLKRALDADRLVTAVNDHRGAMGPLETRALMATGIAIVLGVALFAGLFAVSVGIGFGAVGAAPARFDLMARLGADPNFIGVMFGQRSGWMAFAGGCLGALVADLVLAFAIVDPRFWRSLAAAAYVEPHPRDALWAFAWPLMVAVVAALGGGLGARRAIVRRERRI